VSVSLVGRLVRPVVLLVAGMLIAQTTVSIAATSVSPNATQTRSVSCQAMNFHPIEAGTGFRIKGATLLTRWDAAPNTDDNAGFFACDPHPPDRAVVTKVRFTLKDITSAARVSYCGLNRSSLKPGSAGTFQTLAQVSTTGMAAAPGIVRKSDSSIAHATIDTTDWAYWLQCRIEFEAASGTDAAGIYGASIDYRISSTNG
jgi:hypothetical protein